MIITYAHPLTYFKLSLDYLSYLMQCKCYLNSCQCTENSNFAFWNFLEKNFFFQILLIQSWLNLDTELLDRGLTVLIYTV